MPTEVASGKPTTRRCSDEEKAAAVRMVKALRGELDVAHGTVQRVATQLGDRVEPVLMRVKQAHIDHGVVPDVSTQSTRTVRDQELIAQLDELWEANCRVSRIRKLWKAARRAEIRIGRHQTAPLMRVASVEEPYRSY